MQTKDLFNDQLGENMTVPDYLTYFFREGQPLFQTICDLDEEIAEQILKHDILWRGDGTYLAHRKQHEHYLQELFIKKGGRPIRQYPIYMILGDSPKGPHDLHLEYDYKVILPVSIFMSEDISFTYPDSLYEVPLDDLGRLYLERNLRPRIYCLEEIEEVIKKYKIYEYNNHYLEAQVWNKTPLKACVSEIKWQRCKP